MKRRTALPMLLLSAMLLGCSGGDAADAFRIQGTVTHQGKPVPIGSIIFQPDGSKGNSGAYGSAAIKDGQFDTRNNGQPMVGGPHLVIVEAFDGVDPNPDFAPYGKSLGESYQEAFELPEEDTTLNIELTDRKRQAK
ncbi:hypothetical protein [Blastopirellula retiformator]|uniref:hypothetical protein n=1 Tax=Blastopirellula retiformator TaxID=2527970 RepID=UPI0011B4854F|nr:hypothetical protein [Blastopirellula retiformator]